MMTHPPLGAIESPRDYRDDIVAAAMAAEAVIPISLPTKFREEMGTVLHQQQTPSCVAHSVTLEIRKYWHDQTGKWIDFSPRFLDVLAKQFDGVDINGGTYPRLVWSLAAKYGCATTKTVPNDTSLPIVQYRNPAVLTQEAYEEAAKYKIPGYVAIKKTPQAMREAVFFYGSISALFRVGNELWTPSWAPKHTDPLRTPATVESGHQMNPIGWENSQFAYLRNSWGTLWANKGETRYDDKKWDQYIVEAWAVADIPKDLKQYLANLPKPADFHYSFDVNLKRGDVGEGVKALQIAYMILGFMAPVEPADLGIFGPKTSEANKKFQQSVGISPLAPDNVGPKTRDALKKKFAV